MTLEKAFKRYKSFLEDLTADKLYELALYVTVDVKFCDPFHDVSGLPHMESVFRKLFNKVNNINFTITDYAFGERVVYFQWELNGMLSGRSWTVEGVSHITFNDDFLVTRHIEHWDAASQFYERIFFIGSILRFLRRQISAT